MYNTYRVYGWAEDNLDSFDEYYITKTAKEAVKAAKESHPGYKVVEVSKVLKSWKE